MCFRSCPADNSNPTPNPSMPALLLMVVRFFDPLRASARIRFSGIPHSPKPPSIMTEPSPTSRIASSALATTLFIAFAILTQTHHGDTESRSHGENNRKSYIQPITNHTSPWLRDSVVGLFLYSTLLQSMCLLKFFCQLPRCKILPDVRQPLLYFEERILQIALVADRDVAPHRIWTRRNACHLLQRTSACRKQWRFFAELLHQGRSKRAPVLSPSYYPRLSARGSQAGPDRSVQSDRRSPAPASPAPPTGCRALHPQAQPIRCRSRRASSLFSAQTPGRTPQCARQTRVFASPEQTT